MQRSALAYPDIKLKYLGETALSFLPIFSYASARIIFLVSTGTREMEVSLSSFFLFSSILAVNSSLGILPSDFSFSLLASVRLLARIVR